MKATVNVNEMVRDVQADVDAVLADPIYWFPVRHHSAAAAKYLTEVLQERQPRLILVEGPYEANELLPALADSKTKPPVAIYSCFQDDDNKLGLAENDSLLEDVPPRWACWYPLVDYSPELVAIRAARKLKATVRFVDLPHAATLRIEAAATEAMKPSQPESEESEDSETGDAEFGDRGGNAERPERAGDAGATTPAQYLDESLLATSDFYQSLAEAAGYRSWEEGWDALFEFRDFENAEEFRREMLTFCAAARATSQRHEADSAVTLARERFMMRRVHEEMKVAGVTPEETMVVCGGYHVFLDRADDVDPPKIPDGSWYTTVVPYTYFRLSSLSGYGAGNRAPAYYQLCWDAARNANQDSGPDTAPESSPMTTYIVKVLQRARKKGENLSAADSISIAQHARMLAALRKRGVPLLDDIHDAIITCCCKGSPAEQGIQLLQAIDDVAIGNLVGKVSDKAKRLPIVEDFYSMLEKVALGDVTQKERRKRVKLDKREADQLATSAFLHQLMFIDVPFCKVRNQDSDFASGTIFQEEWDIKWSPDVEAKLIERNLLGDTVESAAVNHLRTQIIAERGHAAHVCSLLVDAMQMGLPDLVEQVFNIAVAAIEEDSRFASLSHSVAELARLQRFAEHQDFPKDQLDALFDRAFARACFAMVDIANAPDDQHSEIVSGLTALADIARKDKNRQLVDLFVAYLRTTLDETELPFLRGALLGLAVETKIEKSRRIAFEIDGFAASGQEQMSRAGDFVHGVISVSRASLMTGGTLLVDAIDNLLASADWECFMTMLPRLRAAMELLHARHRDSIATRVAEKYGMRESQSLQRLEVSVAAASRVAQLDQQVAEIMKHWWSDE